MAGESLFGSGYRVGENRGKPRDATAAQWRGLVLSTIHPSAVLRGPDPEARSRNYAGLVPDLTAARKAAFTG